MSLDEIQGTGLDFVGPVNRDINLRVLVQRGKRNIQSSRLGGGALGRWDTCDAQSFLDAPPQGLYGKRRRRPGSQADDHSIADLCCR